MRPTIVATNKLTVRGKRHHHPAWSALTDQNPTRRCNFFNVNGLSRQVQWVTPTPIPANRQFPTVYLETAGQRPQTKPTASTPVPKTVAPVTLSPWLNRPAQTGSSGEPANRNQQLGILWGDPAFFGGKVIELSLARAARKISQKNFVPAQHAVGIRDHFPVPPAPCAEVIPGCWAQIPHLSTSPGRQLHRISPAVRHVFVSVRELSFRRRRCFCRPPKVTEIIPQLLQQLPAKPLFIPSFPRNKVPPC